MKNQLSKPSKTKGLPGETLKARLIIVVVSLLAFIAAVALYFALKVDEKASVFAGNNLETTIGSPINSMQEYPHVPGRILVRVSPEHRAACSPGDINIPAIKRLFQELGINSIRKNFPQAEPIIGDVRNSLGQEQVDLSLIYELQCDTASDIMAACRLLSGHSSLVYAEPRYIYETLITTPNDPYIQYQWYLDTMHVREAWDLSTGDTNVVIGIIDTGTDFAHDELDNEKVAYNYADPIDGIDNDNDGYIDNFRGWDFGGNSYWAPADNFPQFVGSGSGMDHGVLVSGVAVAQPNNNKGLAGAGFNTRYLPLKASVDQSLGISYGMDAIVYAADHGANVVNLSWGSGAYSNYGRDIVNYAAINKNCLLVAACGNQHNNTFYYPASYKNVISTAATQTQDGAWTNGNGTGTSYNYLVGVSAPGRNTITSTGNNSYWAGATGTSMASPLVCAVAALVKAKFPGLTNVQAGQVVRTTAKNIDATNPGIAERIGKGQVDAFAALTTLNPKSVRFETMQYYDGNNNIPESFDTLEIVANFVNWLDPTSNLNIEISSPNIESIEVLDGTASLGVVGTMDTASNSVPFRIVIKQNITVPTRLWLRFGISDGAYTDYDYTQLIVYPNMIDLDANKLHTTMNGVGNFGFVDFPGFQYGLGMQYDGYSNIIRDAGFLVGISQNNVVDNIRNDIGARDLDMAPSEKPFRQVGPLAPREARAWFEDVNGGPQAIGIEVSQKAYQWNDPANDQYVIMEYVVRNTNNYPINGAYAGLQTQWNRAYYACSNANYFPAARAVAAEFDAISSTFCAGMAMLSDQNLRAFTTNESVFDFSGNSKFEALRNNPNGQPTQSGDVIQFISAGPFNLGPGDSVIVAFALMGASDMQQLTEVSKAAQVQYHCLVRNKKPTVDAGVDVTVCEAGVFPQVNAVGSPGVSYLWSTGDTTSGIMVVESGEYVAMVTNAYGCTALDTVSVNIRNLGGLSIATNNTDFEAGAPVGFTVPDPGNELISWLWDFGDGNTTTAPNPSHIYSEPGSYAVTAIVSNGFCSDTLDYPVMVVVPTGLSSQFDGTAKFFPNPVRDVLKFRLEYDYLGEIKLEILGLSGRKVRSEIRSKSGYAFDYQMDLSDLSQGVYLARAIFGDKVHTQKITRQ
jgi:subtilisin family serine protease